MNHLEAVAAELDRISIFLRRETKRVTDEHGLSGQQFAVLKAVAEKGPAMQRDLASEFMVEKSGMSKSTSKLVSMGLVRRELSPDDGRAWLVSITPKGEDVLKECTAGFEAIHRSRLENAAGDNMKQILILLRELGNAVTGSPA